MNINEAYTSINAVVLNEKFDERKAEVTLKDLKMVYGQAKMIGASKAAQDELKRVYSRLVVIGLVIMKLGNVKYQRS